MYQTRRTKSDYKGNIDDIRAIEDSIRATINYTETMGTMGNSHPVQGKKFRSPVFSKNYEVYPDTPISWDMPAGVALEWLTGKRTIIHVKFFYDYRDNEASVRIGNGNGAINRLEKAIPGFKEALERLNHTSESGKE